MKWRAEPKQPVDRTQWHHWFAWYPVRSGRYMYWLRWMDRKGVHHDDSLGGYWVYEYQELVYYP